MKPIINRFGFSKRLFPYVIWRTGSAPGFRPWLPRVSHIYRARSALGARRSANIVHIRGRRRLARRGSAFGARWLRADIEHFRICFAPRRVKLLLQFLSCAFRSRFRYRRTRSTTVTAGRAAFSCWPLGRRLWRRARRTGLFRHRHRSGRRRRRLRRRDGKRGDRITDGLRVNNRLSGHGNKRANLWRRGRSQRRRDRR